MAYEHKVIRCTLFGTMYNGAEEWSTGFFIGQESTDVPNPDIASAAAIYDHWATFFAHADAGISWAWLTTGCKVSVINADGTTDLSNIYTYYPGSAVAGGYAVTGHPPQVALVASLVAGVGKGLGYKGRMYIPGVSHPVMGDGHMATDKTLGISLRLQEFYDAVNADADVPGWIINASQGRTAPAAPPINRLVTEIRVGNVFDTQRRRRNNLAETYSIRAITTA